MIKSARVFLLPSPGAPPTSPHPLQTFLSCRPHSIPHPSGSASWEGVRATRPGPLIFKTPVAPVRGLREVPARRPSWQPLGCAHSPKMQRPRPLNPQLLAAIGTRSAARDPKGLWDRRRQLGRDSGTGKWKSLMPKRKSGRGATREELEPKELNSFSPTRPVVLPLARPSINQTKSRRTGRGLKTKSKGRGNRGRGPREQTPLPAPGPCIPVHLPQSLPHSAPHPNFGLPHSVRCKHGPGTLKLRPAHRPGDIANP